MPNESWRSVRVTWLDRPGTIACLREAVSALARDRPEVERVVLFGSLARGDAAPGSDADLLIVLSDSPLPFLDRIPAYTPRGCGIGDQRGQTFTFLVGPAVRALPWLVTWYTVPGNSSRSGRAMARGD